MKIILLGPPGAGKGTQAGVLSKHFDIPTISTGAMIRAEIRANTKRGIAAKKLIEEGLLVSDEAILDMLRERLDSEDCKNGFILDGVPRTIAQAEEIATFVNLNAVINIEALDNFIVERLGGRRECSGCGMTYHIVNKPTVEPDVCDICGEKLVIRPDDMPETIKKRLKVYHEQTEPLKNFYNKTGQLISFDGTKAIDDLAAEIIQALEVKSV